MIHQCHTITETLCFFHIMSNKKDCNSFFFIQFMNRAYYIFSSIWVQHGSRFI